MGKSFSVILSELRKEKGLSQKEAAAKLGVSQALLSHYEKGIRECGQSFLVKVADFYDVSCDYLLGRTEERNDIMSVGRDLLSENNDFDATSKTYIKAAMILREAMNNGEKLSGANLGILLAIGLYRVLLIQAYTGNIPKNWAGKAYVDGKVFCNPLYLNTIDITTYNAFTADISKNPVPDAPVPEAIETLVKTAEDFVLGALANDVPPASADYIN